MTKVAWPNTANSRLCRAKTPSLKSSCHQLTHPGGVRAADGFAFESVTMLHGSCRMQSHIRLLERVVEIRGQG